MTIRQLGETVNLLDWRFAASLWEAILSLGHTINHSQVPSPGSSESNRLHSPKHAQLRPASIPKVASFLSPPELWIWTYYSIYQLLVGVLSFCAYLFICLILNTCREELGLNFVYALFYLGVWKIFIDGTWSPSALIMRVQLVAGIWKEGNRREVALTVTFNSLFLGSRYVVFYSKWACCGPFWCSCGPVIPWFPKLNRIRKHSMRCCWEDSQCINHTVFAHKEFII